MASGRVEVIDSKGCSKLVVGVSSSLPSLRSFHSVEPPSPACSATSDQRVLATGPFSGLVICVTGLSKEARKQVMAATEKLGGEYSSNLHPQCTHLVVQSFGGRKFEHAVKHGSKNGLYLVTLSWFIDSVKRNVRMSESLYNVKGVGENGLPVAEWNNVAGLAGSENSCLPPILQDGNTATNMNWRPHLRQSGKESSQAEVSFFDRQFIYIDSNISSEMQKKVTDAATEAGAVTLDHWFVGCRASHVVCEGPSIQRYIGHANNLVTPLWILKTVKEKYMQRLVHMSVDLARQVSMMLENVQNGVSDQEKKRPGGIQDTPSLLETIPGRKTKHSLQERQQIVDLAKIGVRKRRDHRMQLCQTPIRPITPGSLLESICWSISEPTSTACIYTDSSLIDDATEQHTSEFFDAREDGRDLEASFNNFSRSLRESEKRSVIFKNHFLTILFPIDRFGEMGPSSRTFFSDGGFSCLQLLDHIYAFYQDNLSADEIDAAIHTDSRHADRLRLIYASKESSEHGYVTFKRIDFLGSRRSFEMLKRVSGDSNSNVYELVIRA